MEPPFFNLKLRWSRQSSQSSQSSPVLRRLSAAWRFGCLVSAFQDLDGEKNHDDSPWHQKLNKTHDKLVDVLVFLKQPIESWWVDWCLCWFLSNLLLKNPRLLCRIMRRFRRSCMVWGSNTWLKFTPVGFASWVGLTHGVASRRGLKRFSWKTSTVWWTETYIWKSRNDEMEIQVFFQCIQGSFFF